MWISMPSITNDNNSIMRRLFLWGLLLLSASLQAKTIPFGKGQLTFKTVAPNAVRIQYTQGETTHDLPDWMYVKHDEVAGDIKVYVDHQKGMVRVADKKGNTVFTATRHQFQDGEATLVFSSPYRTSTSLDSDSFRTAIVMSGDCPAGLPK